jgi:hypothetical protein
MPRKAPAPKLAVVGKSPEPTHPQPPSKLGATGLALWRGVVTNYAFDDPGSIEILHQACQAADRAEACRRIIDEDGEALRTRTGPKAHPLLRDELNNRTFVVRSLARLGLDLEPIRTVTGRPPGAAFV